MGGDTSRPLPVLPCNNYCCITTHLADSLALLYLGKAEVDAVRHAILTNWLQGIQEENYMCEGQSGRPTRLNCLKIKMRGYPFQMQKGKEQSVAVRLLCANIVSSMHNLGWKCVVSSDLSRTCDRGAWFFQRQQLTQTSYPLFSIGLSSTDKLQINDCPENIHSVIRHVCATAWVSGIQNESKEGRTYEIKLNGNPWAWVNKIESCSARYLVKEIIQKLTAHRFDLHLNSNLTGTADTLFFQYNQYLQTEVPFCVVSLNRNDRLRMIHAPEAICHAIKDTVTQHWVGGIQNVEVDQSCFELKLKGTPWFANGQEAAASRRLISRILEKMASLGWYCMTGIDMSRKPNDKSALLFRQGAPLRTSFMCLSLNETDKVRFIDAPENVVMAGRRVVEQWSLGLSDSPTPYPGVTYQAKLNGNPWSAIATGDGIYGRAMLLGLWSTFNSLGWRLVLSGDVSAKYIHRDNGPDYPIDVHSWWFMWDQTLLAPQPQNQGMPMHMQGPPMEAPPAYDSIAQPQGAYGGGYYS